MTLKLAISGVGSNAVRHAAAAQKLAGVELWAVVGQPGEATAAFAAHFQVPRCYASLAELLAAAEVDALVARL